MMMMMMILNTRKRNEYGFEHLQITFRLYFGPFSSPAVLCRNVAFACDKRVGCSSGILISTQKTYPYTRTYHLCGCDVLRRLTSQRYFKVSHLSWMLARRNWFFPRHPIACLAFRCVMCVGNG